MSATRLDTSRRMADVKGMISTQMLLKSELNMRGLPADGAQRLIDILKCCLAIIEVSQTVADEPLDALVPSAVTREAA